DRIDRQIAESSQPPFAIAVFDVNDLKKVNDTAGHQAGDQCLRDSCAVICDIFKHSPVFRIGGDEFAVIVRNRDYEHLEALIEEMRLHNADAIRNGGNVIACGMSRFEEDENVAAVFARADKNMYENKSALKSGKFPV
ncbi:MAG: GGDEF domain-containing protein, partial [Atopobiaceae bacterium]|nr:GGDEF domain-containing protein [Atopobiaceae bacterium]